MDPQLIARAYDELAAVWNSEEYNRAYGMAQHERALSFVREKGAALDVGCGCSGRVIDLLLARGFAVEGVDISPRMVELARQRHPQVTIHEADICRWDLPDRYTFITAWDSIWHVPLNMQAHVLRKLLRALSPGGILLFTMGGLVSAEEKTDNAMGPEVYYSTLGIPGTLGLISGEGCVCRHLEFDQWPEKHLYIVVEKL